MQEEKEVVVERLEGRNREQKRDYIFLEFYSLLQLFFPCFMLFMETAQEVFISIFIYKNHEHF